LPIDETTKLSYYEYIERNQGVANMFQMNIKSGREEIIITANKLDDGTYGTYSWRIYINNGETATHMTGKAKTATGAKKAATNRLAKFRASRTLR
jgi:hypothetical protein